MEIQHLNLIKLGIILALHGFLSMLMFMAFCKIFNVKINKASVLAGKSVLKRKVFSIEFNLGWLMGSTVEYFGSDPEIVYNEHEKKYAILYKSNAVKLLLAFLPFIVNLILALIVLDLLSLTGFQLADLILFLKNSFLALFGDEKEKQELLVTAFEITAKNDKALFAMLVCQTLLLFGQAFGGMQRYLIFLEIKKGVITLFILSALLFIPTFILLWRCLNYREIITYTLYLLTITFLASAILYVLFISCLLIAEKKLSSK